METELDALMSRYDLTQKLSTALAVVNGRSVCLRQPCAPAAAYRTGYIAAATAAAS